MERERGFDPKVEFNQPKGLVNISLMPFNVNGNIVVVSNERFLNISCLRLTNGFWVALFSLRIDPESGIIKLSTLYLPLLRVPDFPIRWGSDWSQTRSNLDVLQIISDYTSDPVRYLTFLKDEITDPDELSRVKEQLIGLTVD